MQILRRHFSRYTPEMVSQVCGCTPEAFRHVAELLCENSGRERTSALVYAVGWTQHTTGVQIIRTAGILQLLLGNVGRPGGGIMAMRGHSSIQGSTDVATLYDTLPGYLPQPADFWKTDPTGPPPSAIQTEVFFIPAASAPEKEGTLTNTQRLLQYHNKALDPPGDCRSDAWFVYQLGKRLRALYAESTDPKD